MYASDIGARYVSREYSEAKLRFAHRLCSPIVLTPHIRRNICAQIPASRDVVRAPLIYLYGMVVVDKDGGNYV